MRETRTRQRDSERDKVEGSDVRWLLSGSLY